MDPPVQGSQLFRKEVYPIFKEILMMYWGPYQLSLQIGAQVINSDPVVCSLGVYEDPHLSTNQQINHIC